MGVVFDDLEGALVAEEDGEALLDVHKAYAGAFFVLTADDGRLAGEVGGRGLGVVADEEQARIVDDLICQLGAEATPCIRVFNKCDRYAGILPHGENNICISAISGEGSAQLVDALQKLLSADRREYVLAIPYKDAGIVDLLKREAAVRSIDFDNDAIRLRAIVNPEIYGRIKPFIIDDGEIRE